MNSCGTNAHPGQTAKILCGDSQVGWIGTIHPNTQKALGVDANLVLVELDLAAVLLGSVPEFKGVSKFPETSRDLAFVVEQGVKAGDMIAAINQTLASDEIFQGVDIFDVYQGKGIEEGHKSIALGLTFRHPDRTLNDDEVNDCINRIIASLSSELGAILRN